MANYSFYEEPTSSGTFGTCGEGSAWQANIQMTANPTFELLAVPEEKDVDHWPELAEMARQVNSAFQEIFEETVEEAYLERKEDQPNLEVTLHLDENGFRLVYAERLEDREETALPPPPARASQR